MDPFGWSESMACDPSALPVVLEGVWVFEFGRVLDGGWGWVGIAEVHRGGIQGEPPS